jgi:hypothetical protein
MSDAEVLCDFMDPKHVTDWWGRDEQVLGKPPHYDFPRDLDLDALHEIESRLTDEQWDEYVDVLSTTATGIPYGCNRNNYSRRIIHATAGEKKIALAKVLRASVEGR